MRWFTVFCLALGSISCGGPIDEVQQIAAVDALRGEWRTVLESPGGELPFGLRVTIEKGRPSVVILNDIEEVPTSSVSVNGDRVVIDMDWYDSRLEGRLSPDGRRIDGSWTKVIPGGVSQLGWVAEKGAAARFRPPAVVGIPTGDPAAVEDVAGIWQIVFTDEAGTEQARGEFIQDSTRVTGTMLTDTGDYRYLDGSYEDGVLRLSTFDGAHAFLFQPRATAEGCLAGYLCTLVIYIATLTAVRIVA